MFYRKDSIKTKTEINQVILQWMSSLNYLRCEESRTEEFNVENELNKCKAIQRTMWNIKCRTIH